VTTRCAFYVEIGIDKIMQKPSFVQNTGKVSFTYQDSGYYGQYINTCRIAAWQLALERHGIPKDTILDVGCSYGSWADNWRHLGFKKLMGLEPFSEYARKAEALFDQVKVGYSYDLPKLYPEASVVGANGVIVHIIEAAEQRRFLSDIYEILRPGGFMLFSVINADSYLSPSGRQPWAGPNSCTRTLADHEKIAGSAGLNLIDKIGTFINPWLSPAFDFIANDEELKNSWGMYEGLLKFAEALRQKDVAVFSEVLYIAKKPSAYGL
jgi:SAM-dependent methyltransferase